MLTGEGGGVGRADGESDREQDREPLGHSRLHRRGQGRHPRTDPGARQQTHRGDRQGHRPRPRWRRRVGHCHQG